MILFFFGFSLCINIILIILFIILYNNFTPIFRSIGVNVKVGKKNYDLDNFDFKSFWGDDIDV